MNLRGTSLAAGVGTELRTRIWPRGERLFCWGPAVHTSSSVERRQGREDVCVGVGAGSAPSLPVGAGPWSDPNFKNRPREPKKELEACQVESWAF